MDKREKVIKGLECHFLVDMEPCEKCSYYMRKDCTGDLAKDALELLKAQEEKVKTKCNTGMTQWYVCTGCDASVNPGDRFCRICGKVLVWG